MLIQSASTLNSGSTQDQNDNVPSEEEVPTSKSGPFQPLYSVQVPNATKNGDVLQYTIKTFQPDGETEIKTVTRQYEDIEWLQHCIMTQNDVLGLILPPLPLKPETDAKAAEKSSKKQLGSSTNVLMPDEFHKYCRSMEKYLKMIVEHEVFGQDKTLQQFLCESDAPVRARVKKGIISRLSSVVDEARKGMHRDIDEYFHNQRETMIKYSAAVKEAAPNFNKMVVAQMRLSCCYGHLATSLSSMDVYKEEQSVQMNMLMSKLAEGMEDAKHGLEVLCANDEKTLGFQLDLYARYMDMVKEMLFKRTTLLVDYEDAKKSLEKAKPMKKAAAEELKIKTEKEYEKCCDNARRELKSFTQQRVISFEEGLSSFAESQIKTARDSYTLLVRTLKAVKQLDL